MEYFEQFAPHWSFFAVMIILAVVGQVVKSVVGKGDSLFRRWFWRTLPLHPVFAGGLVGLVRGIPLPFTSGPAGAMLYFAFAGVCSTWAYAVIKQVFKRYGVKVDGTSNPPPTA